MPYDAADDDILKLFKPCGEIAQVRAGIDAGTQRTKGFAYIEFATQEAADKAMAMINPMLKGRTLRLVRGFFFFFFLQLSWTVVKTGLRYRTQKGQL